MHIGIIAGAALALASADARADVTWVDWTSSDASSVYGSLTLDGAVVGVTYTGERSFVQTNGGTNYWNPATPYISATVPNPPPTPDIIALHLQTSKQLTFSEPVTNPLFAVMSLNGNGYRFNRDFTILSQGRGYWGNGTLTRVVTTLPDGTVSYDLNGSGEPHGVIQFLGTFDTVAWTSLANENWNGFTIAVEHRAEVVPPEIEVHDGMIELLDGQPELWQVGDLLPGESTTRVLTLTNTGLGPLELGAAWVDDDAGAFSVGPLPPALAPGDSALLEVTFTPPASGAWYGALHIPNGDADESPFDVTLYGAADTDGDGVRDGEDVCPGADDALDGDGDGAPDGCDFLLAATPLAAGAPITLSVDRAPPGQLVYFLGTTAGTGAGPCAPGVCVDLLPRVRVLGSAPADASGHASVTLTAPPATPSGARVWLQAGYPGAPGDTTQVVSLVAR